MKLGCHLDGGLCQVLLPVAEWTVRFFWSGCLVPLMQVFSEWAKAQELR